MPKIPPRFSLFSPSISFCDTASSEQRAARSLHYLPPSTPVISLYLCFASLLLFLPLAYLLFGVSSKKSPRRYHRALRLLLNSFPFSFRGLSFGSGGQDHKMDIISQLQEQVNTIAGITFNTFGTLQRDAPPVRLSPNYPEPPANTTDSTVNISEQPKIMSAAIVKAAKQFDTLVAALPVSEGDEEAQLKQIAELEAENEAIGQELQRQLEAAEQELKQVRELYSMAADNCLNMKKPD